MISPGSFVGKYQLLQKLNSTLYGERFLAQSSTSFNITVAIKLWYTSGQQATLLHEVARAQAQLQHTYILPIIDFGIQDGLFYIVTSYSTPAPETLRERLTRHQTPEPMPTSEALNILTQVGQALQFAHEQGILHGQLTPDSILLTPAGTALLSDLGMANLRDVTIPRGTPLSAIKEQYAYTSPELLRGEVSKTSDQYALGSIAYELFTGLPYQTLTPPRAINPALSPAIEAVILKVLAPQAANRFTNVSAFIDSLTYAVTSPATLPAEQGTVNHSGDTAPSFALIPPSQPIHFSAPDWNASPHQQWQPTQPISSIQLILQQEQSGGAGEHQESLQSYAAGNTVPLQTESIQSYAAGNTVPLQTESIQPKSKTSSKGMLNILTRRRMLGTLIFFIVLIPLLMFSVLSFIPASAAVVKVTPISKHLTKTYIFNGVTDNSNSDQHQITAHVITYITPKQTKTFLATGRKQQEATSAQGELVFSNVGSNETIDANQKITAKGGIQITIDKTFTINVGETITVPAHATKPGADGNIDVDGVNDTYSIVDPANPTRTTTVLVQNVKPFTGGQDAIDVTFVQQSDVDNVVNPLITQMTSDAQLKLDSMVQANQIPVGQARCTPNTQTQPAVNTPAKLAKVSIEVICLQDTYIEQEISDAAIAALKQDSKQELGANYGLQGDVVTDKPVLDSPSVGNSSLRFHVKVDSIWVYKFTPAIQQQILQNIAGKNQFSAIDYLQHSAGVNEVTISTSGLGWALPISIQTIQFMPVVATPLK